MAANETALSADRLRRLSAAEGHLRGIASMLERGAGCESVVHPVCAVQAASRQAARRSARHHLGHCVRQRLSAGSGDENAREQRLSEVAARYR
jgi:DNA-binding FrmR family transcriptional regulator